MSGTGYAAKKELYEKEITFVNYTNGKQKTVTDNSGNKVTLTYNGEATLPSNIKINITGSDRQYDGSGFVKRNTQGKSVDFTAEGGVKSRFR